MEIAILIAIAIGIWIYKDHKKLAEPIKRKIGDTGNSNKVESYEKYRAKKWLLSKTETAFLKELRNEAGENQIHAQVRLADIVYAGSRKDKEYRTRFNRIQSKSIDFVITDTETKIIAAIELDDWTHKKKNRVERDKIVNKICENAGIKLIRMKVSNQYDFRELREVLEKEL